MLDARPVILLEQSFALWMPCRGYVEDVAQAIALAAISERATGRIYNIADVDPYPESQWTVKIGEVTGWKGRVVAVSPEQLPPHLALPHNFQQHLFMDSKRIRTELGYTERVSIDEALRRTIHWEQSNPPLTVDPAQFNYPVEDEAAVRIS